MNNQISSKDVEQFVLKQFASIDSDDENLVRFHTINKYLLMAHSQIELNILGNLVANLDKKPIGLVLGQYENHLKVALNRKPTLASNVNVLTKIYSHFRKKLNQNEKETFLKAIEDFGNEKVSLGEILNTIKNFTIKYENTYLARQTYYLLYSSSESGKKLDSNLNN